MSLSEEQSICSHHPEPPPRWRLPAEFVLLEKKNATKKWPDSLGFCWSWNQADWTFPVYFPFLVLSQKFLKSAVVFGWVLNCAVNWSCHPNFHRARDLLGFCNICGWGWWCWGNLVVLHGSLEKWGIRETWHWISAPLQVLKKKKNHIPSIGRSSGSSRFGTNPSRIYFHQDLFL